MFYKIKKVAEGVKISLERGKIQQLGYFAFRK